jgi:hypothetical protein
MISQSPITRRLLWAICGLVCVIFSIGARGCFGGDSGQSGSGGATDASMDDVSDANSSDAIDATSDAPDHASFKFDASDARWLLVVDADAGLDADATLCPSPDDCLVGGGGVGDSTADDGDGEANADASDGDAAEGGDAPGGPATECAYDWQGCLQDHVCCNNLVPIILNAVSIDAGCTQPGNIECASMLGQACSSAMEEPLLVDKTQGLCGNTNGGTSGVGTLVATVGGDQCYVDSCSSDSDCLIGYTCGISSCNQRNCYQACSALLSGPSAGYAGIPCCDGLIDVGGTCLLPSGFACRGDGSCASGHCVFGATTALCE